MRGQAFHNQIAAEAKTIFNRQGWQVYTEFGYFKDAVLTYFDLFAVKARQSIACEIETTSRHALDNALKAQAVGIVPWILVPSRRVRHQIECKLSAANV